MTNDDFLVLKLTSKIKNATKYYFECKKINCKGVFLSKMK
jgi:hypothetical protein